MSNPRNERPGSAAWRLIQPFWKTVSIYDGPFVFLEGIERLPGHVRHLFAIHWCDSEVCNGGFHQFFSNSTGMLAPEAIEGFYAVGLPECAQLVEAAVAQFEEPYPRDRSARREALELLRRPGERRDDWDSFSELDDRYYATKERVKRYEHLDKYAKRHSD